MQYIKYFKIYLILISLFYSLNIFSVNFIVYNFTESKLQPFLYPVHISGFLPNGQEIDKNIASGFIENGKIIYIEPFKNIKIKLNIEKRNNLTFDFSKAKYLNLKTSIPDDSGWGGITIDSNSIKFKNKKLYMANMEDQKLVLTKLFIN